MVPQHKDPSEIYTREWFQREYIDDKSQAPAWEIIADGIIQVFKPDRVLDIGCGPGLLVKALVYKNVDARGIDGSTHAVDLAKESLKSLGERINLFNVAKQELMTGKYYDLVVSTEVAEHIDAQFVDQFVDNLVQPRPKHIILTAATVGQGGLDHRNEQPPEYWIAKFEQRSYKVNRWRIAAIKELWAPAERLWFLAKNVLVFERA